MVPNSMLWHIQKMTDLTVTLVKGSVSYAKNKTQ